MKSLLLVFSFCLILSVRADITDIPCQDLKNIKLLFEDLIDYHDYAYTIFGSKPMSLADFCLETPKNLALYKWIGSKIFITLRRKPGPSGAGCKAQNWVLNF